MKKASVILAAALVILGVTGAVNAHKKSPPGVREFVRIQGYGGSQPIDVPVIRTVELFALGQSYPFRVTRWRQFRLDDSPSPEETARQLTLQGERATLRRFTTARPEQRVTILSERRPGSRDLFVVELDLCPPD